MQQLRCCPGTAGWRTWCTRGRHLPQTRYNAFGVVVRANKDDEQGPDRSYEDLFKEEIARRGISGGSVTSSKEDSESAPGSAPGSSTRSNPFSADRPAGIPGASSSSRARGAGASYSPPGADPSDPGTDRQRERSIAMVNEGLEGLIPRASQLLQLGGSVFLAFLPFMLAISLLFSGIYFVFGDSFIHGGEVGKGLPAYIDAEALLAEPTVDPRIPYM